MGFLMTLASVVMRFLTGVTVCSYGPGVLNCFIRLSEPSVWVHTVTGRPFFAKRGVAILLVMGAMVGID